jgi:hypothetical protein
MDREQLDIAKLTGAFLKNVRYQRIKIPSYYRNRIEIAQRINLFFRGFV